MSADNLQQTIMELAQAGEDGQLSFTDDAERRLLGRFRAELEQPTYAAAVDAFVRTVAAFQAAGQRRAAGRLMDLGTRALAAFRDGDAPAEVNLKGAVTGAENLAKMRPVGAQPAPQGALKATAFIRPLPKAR